MSTISQHLFTDTSTLSVREVVLSGTDQPQTYREKLARIILDEMYQFVGLLDGKGATLEINRAALEGAGIRPSDIQDKPFWEARWWQVSRETREKQRQLVARAATGEFIRCDIEIYGKSSGEETIIIDFSLMPVRDQRGKIVFLLAEGRNITEKKVAEAEIARKNEELQKLLEQIRQLDQLKSDLFANVSHELRTPLALILGPADSLLSSGNLTQAQRRDVSVIRHNAATLLKHVNDLLDLAKLHAGNVTMDYADRDIARMVRTVAAHFDALAPQKAISYAVLAPEVLRAEVDPDKVERVLLNLLSNAFKFTPQGGRIHCALRGNNDRFVLTVQDSGPGIPLALRNRIFERFRQAQAGTTRDFGGTGLGLSIAKDFVQLHGGTITISDAPIGGTLIQVEIPLRAPQGSMVRAVAESGAESGSSIAVSGTVEELRSGESRTRVWGKLGNPKVLVAEDNPGMGRFIAEVLSSDYRVITASDGLEALSMALAEMPDVIVTDLMMSKLGGDQFVKQMRAHEDLAQRPVLVLSAKADETLRLGLLSELAQDYLVKPFSAAELRARVRNLVAMKQTRDLLQQELATQNQDLMFLTQELIASKRTIQESLEAQRRLSTLVENSRDFIGFVSPQGQALFVNPAGRSLVGLDADAVTNTVPVDYVVEEDRELLTAGISAALENGNWEGEVRFRNFKTGAVIPMLQHIFDVTDPQTGRRIGLATISRDITERKRFEEGLRQAQAERAHVSRVVAMGELTASIAHEINQPLSAIVANANACTRMLKVQPPDLEELRMAITDIANSGRRASEVVSRVRALLKKTHSEKSPWLLNVNDLVLEVLPLIRGELEMHRTRLHTALRQDLPPVLGDRIGLQQVLINLLLNGIEAMAAIEDRPRVLQVRSHVGDSGEVMVVVRDSGVGISGDRMRSLFQAFFTTKAGGMGMGLLISRSIIEAHGGKLWATSNQTDGATFQFSLAAA